MQEIIYVVVVVANMYIQYIYTYKRNIYHLPNREC